MYVDTTLTDNQPSGAPATCVAPVANPDNRPDTKRERRPPPARSHTPQNRLPPDHTSWETSGDYRGALFEVPGTPWRVAVCPKGYCWILQRRRGVGRWESLKFFARRPRLATVLRELVGDRAYQAVKDKIEALPI